MKIPELFSALCVSSNFCTWGLRASSFGFDGHSGTHKRDAAGFAKVPSWVRLDRESAETVKKILRAVFDICIAIVCTTFRQVQSTKKGMRRILDGRAGTLCSG